MPFVEMGDDNGIEHPGSSDLGDDPSGVVRPGSGDPMSNAFRSFSRVTLRLVASGALTALVNQFAGGLSPTVASLVLSSWASALTYAQVAVEDKTGKKILVQPSTSNAVVNKLNKEQIGGA